MPTITDLIAKFEKECKKIGYIAESIACYNKTTDRIESFWNDRASGMEILEACTGTAISLIGLANKNDHEIQLALSRAYNAHGMNYIRPETDPQAEILGAIVQAGIKAGAEIVRETQQRAQDSIENDTETLEDLEGEFMIEDEEGAPCSRDCDSCNNGKCEALTIQDLKDVGMTPETCGYYEKRYDE